MFLSALGMLFGKRLVESAFKKRVAETVCPGCELDLFFVNLSNKGISAAQVSQVSESLDHTPGHYAAKGGRSILLGFFALRFGFLRRRAQHLLAQRINLADQRLFHVTLLGMSNPAHHGGEEEFLSKVRCDLYFLKS
jgi:hypothetical protein